MHNIALLLSLFPLDVGHFALKLWEAINESWDFSPTGAVGQNPDFF